MPRLRSFLSRQAVAFCLCSGLLAAVPERVRGQDDAAFEQWLKHLQTLVPRKLPEFRDARRVDSIAKAAQSIDAWAGRVGTIPANAEAAAVSYHAERLVVGHAQVEGHLADLFALRKEFTRGAAVPDGTAASLPAVLSNYLRIQSQLTDLAGRLQYQLEETLTEAAYRVAAGQRAREKLIDMLARRRSYMGAEVMAWLLFDPPPNSPNGAVPATTAVKHQVLRMIAQTGNIEVIPSLARFIRDEQRYPELVIAAADVLRQVGFPQDQRPGDSAGQNRPALTAAQLLPILQKVPAQSLDEKTTRLRDELIRWAQERKDHGIGALLGYSLGGCTVRPGDWMLLRNPSPYNQVTDLAPGLFSHVGVVTDEKGPDGRRRMVVVDLTVMGTRIRTTNLDIFVRQYRDYLFLRHPDPKAAQTLADVARSIIGNEAIFDLNYRIDNVEKLKGQPKKGQPIYSYCAGLLLLSGQELDVERGRLFPVPEQIAGGKTAKNLKELGISFGAHFVSPTGPLFSQEFDIAGHSPAVHDPVADIEQVVYDHFVSCLRDYDLAEDRDSLQKIRVALAEAAKDNPALARLVGELNDINPRMDLVAAAKAAGMLEHLDRAAIGSSRDYVDAFFAITCGPFESLKEAGYSQQQVQRFRKLRARHADWHRQFDAQTLERGALRKAVVAYYVRQGKTELEKHFKVVSRPK